MLHEKLLLTNAIVYLMAHLVVANVRCLWIWIQKFKVQLLLELLKAPSRKMATAFR